MNLAQFYERWPAKDARLFLFADGKDVDRLSVYYSVCQAWSKKVDQLDRIRLHQPNLAQLHEACRMEPINSKVKLVMATEVQPWQDQEGEPTDPAFNRMARLLENFPRDLVLVMTSSVESPNTKNDFAQPIIRKGYWVVLKTVDVLAARELVTRLTSWNEELVAEVVEVIGTSPAQLIAFVRTTRLADGDDPELVRDLLIANPSGGVFELVEATIRKDLPTALRLAPDIPAGQFVGALDRKLSSLLQFTAELKKGRSPKEAALNLRLPGFIVHGLFEASKRWRPSEILGLWPTLAEFATYASRPGSTELLVKRIIG